MSIEIERAISRLDVRKMFLKSRLTEPHDKFTVCPYRLWVKGIDREIADLKALDP